MPAVRLTASKVQPAEPPSDSLFPDPSGFAKDRDRLFKLLVARLGAETSYAQRQYQITDQSSTPIAG